MVHDFSEQKKSELRSQLQEIENDGQNIIFDTVGDIVSTFSSWIGILDISNYLGNVSEYHRKIIDQRDMKMDELLEIFDNVEGVDRQYQAEILRLTDALEEYRNGLSKLALLMSADKKSFTVENVGKIGKVITGGISNGNVWTGAVFDRQLDKAEARVLKETAKDLVGDAFLVIGSLLTIFTAPNPVKKVASAWELVDGVFKTGQDLWAVSVIGLGNTGLLDNGKGKNSTRLELLQCASEYQEADGLEGQLRMDGHDQIANFVGALDTGIDFYNLVDTASDIVESAGKIEKILTGGIENPQEAMEELLLGEVGLKKKKGTKNIISNIKTVYTYTTGALEGNLGEKIFGKTGLGGFASDVQDFADDIGEYLTKDLGLPGIGDLVCMLN